LFLSSLLNFVVSTTFPRRFDKIVYIQTVTDASYENAFLRLVAGQLMLMLTGLDYSRWRFRIGDIGNFTMRKDTQSHSVINLSAREPQRMRFFANVGLSKK